MIKVPAQGATGMSGSAWDWEKPGDIGISQIFISHDKNHVCSIQFEYVQDEKIVLSPCHGTKYGPIFLCVKFDHPTEFLTRLSGKHDWMGIVSLTFTTNKRSYGPFGDPKEHRMVDIDEFEFGEDYRFAEFEFDVGENRVGGFHGSAGGENLLTIGIYVNLTSSQRTTTSPVQGSKILALEEEVEEETCSLLQIKRILHSHS